MGKNLIKTITTKSHQGELRIWRGRKLIEAGSLPGTDTEAVSTHLMPHSTRGQQLAATEALIAKAWWPMTEVEQ